MHALIRLVKECALVINCKESTISVFLHIEKPVDTTHIGGLIYIYKLIEFSFSSVYCITSYSRFCVSDPLFRLLFMHAMWVLLKNVRYQWKVYRKWKRRKQFVEAYRGYFVKTLSSFRMYWKYYCSQPPQTLLNYC